MTNIFFYLLIGIVQGVLEWLPVSSEGQIVLISIWSGIDASIAISLAFWIHLGTMASVILVYRKEWKRIFNLKIEDRDNLRSLLIVSTIGTAIVGLPLRIFFLDMIDVEVFSGIAMIVIAISLIITGLMIQFSRKDHSKNIKKLSDLTWREHLVAGLLQGFTIIPGISRSGTTVSALLFMNVDSEDSFRGSFLMSVPAILGSVVLDILIAVMRQESLFSVLDPWGVVLAIIMAFIFGTITIKILISIARKYNFASIVIIFGVLILISIMI